MPHMTAPTDRRAVDLAPRSEPHPTVALVLAILAVPGSTVAWDLPAGGLYIGLPLAIVAIVLAVRSLREGAGRTRSIVAIVIAGLCIAQMAIWFTVSAVS